MGESPFKRMLGESPVPGQHTQVMCSRPICQASEPAVDGLGDVLACKVLVS